MTEYGDTTNESRLTNVSRRQFLRRGLAAGAIAGGALALGEGMASRALAATTGPKRKIIWVTHSIGEWNLAVDTGFMDFCDQAGWTYQKLGVPGAAFSAEDNVNQIKLAIQAKPDIIVGTITDPAVEAPLVEAEKGGILVLLNNSSNEEIRAAHNWGFVGAGGFGQGQLVGRRLAPLLIEKGKKNGVIGFGNAEPGHAVLRDRKEGTIAALNEVAQKQGAKFTVEEFADQSHDIAASIPIYSTFLRSKGDSLLAIVGSGYSSMVASYRAVEGAGLKPGSIPVTGFDTGPDINEGIEKGYIIYSVEQELYNQGYLPSAIAWSRLERLNIPPVVNTGTAVVDKDNLKFFADRTKIILDRSKELGIRHA